jgi:hypothetical protein
MKIKIVLFAVLAVAVAGCLIARHWMARAPEQLARQETKSPAAGNELSPAAKSSPAATAPGTLSPAAVSNLSTTPSVAQVEKPAVQTNPQPQTAQAQTDQSPTYNGYQVEDPVARIALYSVGTGDAEADAYWESAIFDPNLPAEERKDLIEDLNETGFADPQHPGPADLPMILARIRLIELLEPHAIDQVDADAFAEAYKDLVGMANGRAPQ